MMVKERLVALAGAVNNSEAPHKHEDLILDCGRYVEKVTEMESAITVARFRMEPEEYREYAMRLDSSRKKAHDALTVSVRVLNRISRLYEAEPVYTGPDERLPVAEFAMEVVAAMFKSRKL